MTTAAAAPPPVSMKALLEAGVHFGHQTHRWDPRMKPFIYAERNGIHIIDLAQTVPLLKQAMDFVRGVSARGDAILFVGTKKQAQDVIVEEATRSGQHYVTQRWLGSCQKTLGSLASMTSQSPLFFVRRSQLCSKINMRSVGWL